MMLIRSGFRYKRTINVGSFKSEYSAPAVTNFYINVTLTSDSGYSFGYSFLVYERFFTARLQPFEKLSLKNFDKSEIKFYGILPNVSCDFSDRSTKIDFFICDEAVIDANRLSYSLTQLIVARKIQMNVLITRMARFDKM